MDRLRFLDDDGTFVLENPETVSGLYFPLAGEAGLKSAVTPLLGGDSKLDQEHFLLQPVSVEDLHNNRSGRNFWCVTERGCWSAAGSSAEQEAERFTEAQEESAVTAGLMWHTVSRRSERYRLSSEITAFVPVRENAEVMLVRVTNTDETPQSVQCTAAVPLYGRSADNLRDHRHVTSLLHRIRTVKNGVLVKPTMSFDEKGHRPNHMTCYALGTSGDGSAPRAFYPTVEDFIGEGGSFLRPRAIYATGAGVPAGTSVEGRETMGGLAFPPVFLEPGQSAEFVLLIGMTEDEAEIDRVLLSCGTPAKALGLLEETKAYWQERVNVKIRTGSRDFDRWFRWVSFQPFLRRIFGCSFLPHHDYGRGGRGWRDLWQDCLSLLLMDPDGVREMIAANFGGVRVDGTNATIIGSGDGSFVADRNGIARVWMDHALWPLKTVLLYIDTTGDVELLNAKAAWFKDPQVMRGTQIDERWTEAYGSCQRTDAGEIYESSVLEHLLAEHLTAFYEVGEHNTLRLRGADWNDAMDMASENGESVAFTAAYAGNLRDLAELIRLLEKRTGAAEVLLMAELAPLMKTGAELYDDVQKKRALLRDYTQRCKYSVSGKTAAVALSDLAADLDAKADWMMMRLRTQEWIDAGHGGGWFNSYYDDHGRKLEGAAKTGVRMMLIGQVFAIMSGTATDEQIAAITTAADRYLYRPEIGGYRLNTDFHALKFDMGRMFGFAYGEKENGSVFSHMAVMYANALYRRGHVREGWKALRALAETAMDFETSRIYPGIPEYFRGDGRGQYHYLTGAASWYMMTVLTQAFGVRGEGGDLVIEPKLMGEQFDAVGKASVSFLFAGKRFCVTYVSLAGRDYGEYRVEKALLTVSDSPRMQRLPILRGKALLTREELLTLPELGNEITVELI